MSYTHILYGAKLHKKNVVDMIRCTIIPVSTLCFDLRSTSIGLICGELFKE